MKFENQFLDAFTLYGETLSSRKYVAGKKYMDAAFIDKAVDEKIEALRIKLCDPL